MNIKDYTIPYTAEEDPEVFYTVNKSWFGKEKPNNSTQFKTKRYSDLPYDCKRIVDDIVVSSHLESFKHWDINFRRKYYTKAIFMAYDLGKENNKNVFAKIRGWFYSLIKFKTIK